MKVIFQMQRGLYNKTSFAVLAFLLLFSAFVVSAKEYELDFLAVKPEYRVYFGKRKSVASRIYFLPLADRVLVVSVGETAYLGKNHHAERKMSMLARLNAQKQVEEYFGASMSANQTVSLKNGTQHFSSDVIVAITRQMTMWPVIAKGAFRYRKSYCCVIGKVFPAELFPKSVLE